MPLQVPPDITNKLSVLTNTLKCQSSDLINKLLKREVAQASSVSSRIACDIGKSKIVMLELQKNPDATITIARFKKMSRPKEQDKLIECFKEAFAQGGFSSNKVRISVKGQGVIVRFVQFPKMKIEELRSAITFEAEKYIPFKANEVVVDFSVLDDNVQLPTGVGMNLLLAAVKRDDVYPTLQWLISAGLSVELIDIDALAFINALEFCYPEMLQSAIGVLDIGTEISTLTITRNGKPRFIRDISFGGADIIKRLKRKLGLSDQAAMEQLEVDRAPNPEAVEVLKEGLGNLVSDLKVSLDYYLDQVQPPEPITKLFLAGGGGYHPIVLEELGNNLGLPVQTIDVLSKISLAPGLDAELIKKNQGLIPIALGLALRDL